jgi:hypothetical protein
LFTGDSVCAFGNQVGPWVHVQYTRDGHNQTGWVSGTNLSTGDNQTLRESPTAEHPDVFMSKTYSPQWVVLPHERLWFTGMIKNTGPAFRSLCAKTTPNDERV